MVSMSYSSFTQSMVLGNSIRGTSLENGSCCQWIWGTEQRDVETSGEKENKLEARKCLKI